jgi:hypothetical protein
VVTRTQLRHRRRRALDLIPRRHQRGAVLERPAIILHVRDLDAARAERKRQTDQVGYPVDVGTVYDPVHREWKLLPHDLGRERPLPDKCARVAGDVIGGGGSLSWIDICTWSSPARANAASVSFVIPTAEVMRLV